MTARAALSVRIVAALHEGVVLVARPRGVVHFHAGSLTRGGGAVPGGGRPFCGTRARRLRVVGRTVDDIGAAVAGRRFCRSCTHRLPARLGGRAGILTLATRAEWVEAYGDLTVTDLRLAAAWCQTVGETHQVQQILQMACGPRPCTPPARRTPEQAALVAAYDAVTARRHQLEAAALTPEEIAERQAARDAEAHNRRLTQRARSLEYATEKAHEEHRAGHYLDPRRRELVDSA